jgi:hypothetical protein
MGMDIMPIKAIGMRYTTLCATCGSWSKEVQDTAARKSLSIPHTSHSSRLYPIRRLLIVRLELGRRVGRRKGY